MESKIISVVIPVYNQEKYIERCLRSVLNQNIDDDLYDIVVVNDGSTDNSLKILKKYSDKINLINYEKNIGLPGALNKGIQSCKSKYVVRVDSDDYVINKLREILIAKLGNDHINFFTNLKLKFSVSQYLFVHAGIDPKKKLSNQTKQDYLWSRSDSFFNKDFKAEKIIVHGHTPEKDFIDLPGRINVDTGCYFSGKLSCVCLSDINESRYFISNL